MKVLVEPQKVLVQLKFLVQLKVLLTEDAD